MITLPSNERFDYGLPGYLESGIVNLLNALGVSAGVSGLSSVNTAEAATANTAAIQSALAEGGLVQILTPGTYYSNPLRIPSDTSLLLGAGVILRRADNVNAPLIRNKYGGQKNRATRFNRLSNVVTVNNQYHGFSVGDHVWVSGLTDTTMHGIQTVASVPDVSTWTYASTGSNGAGGAASIYGNIIPIRRTIAGASFSSSSNVVTVTDPGHDIRPGFNVWLGTTGASSSFAGLVEVIEVSPDTWTYVTSSSGTGAASGTFGLSYDNDITIAGDGAIDGNRLNNGSFQDVDIQLSVVSLGVVNQTTISTKRIFGSDIRCVQVFNGCDVVVSDVEFGDTLVGVQYEGSARRTKTLNLRGTTGKQTVAAQLIDDMVAFTGGVTSGASYDSTVSPYGIGPIVNNLVSGMVAPNCLNGMKLAAHSTVLVDYLTVENISGGMLSNNVTPLGNQTAGIRYVDDQVGFSGMVCGNLFVRNVNWYGGANAVLWASSGTCKLLDIEGINYAPNAQQPTGNTSAVAWIQGATNANGRVQRLNIRKFNYIATSSAKPAIIFGNGNVKTTHTIAIDDVSISDGTLTVGGSFTSGSGILKYGNATILGANVNDCTFYGPASGTGHAISCHGPSNMGRWILDRVRVATGAAAMSFVFAVSRSDASDTVCAGEIVLDNCNLNSTSGIYDNASTWSGTLGVEMNNTKLVVSGNAFNINSATGLVVLKATPTTTITVDKVMGAVAGGATFRVNGPSIQLVGSKVTAPQPGDMFWSTDTSTAGSASIGMKARTNAGAWAALF